MIEAATVVHATHVRQLRRWWPLALVLLLGVGLRLYHLGAQPLFSDEAFSWSVSHLTPAEMIQLSERDRHPPLYYFVLKTALTVLPATEAGLRTVSVAASTLALLTVLAFLAAEWGLASAIYAGMLLAFSTFDLYYAQEARMYALLATAWIISYVGLVKALQGRSRWLIVWAVAAIAMSWLHVYGFLVLGAYAAFIVGYLIFRHRLRLATPLADRDLLLASLVVVVATLPMVRALWPHANVSTAHAQIPRLQDLRDLYLLWTAGLAASRYHFLDSSHLILPVTETVRPRVWFLLGSAVIGAPALLGLTRAWRLQGSRRTEAVLAMSLIVLPVVAAIGYSLATNSGIWIQRPFLGAAYLIYLWAGIGFAAMPWRRARWILAALAVVVALASVLPYYTIWQKSNARPALTALPSVDDGNALVLELRYLSPQVHFYLGQDTPVLAIEPDEQGAPQIVRAIFQGDHPQLKVVGRPEPLSCSDLASVTDLWFYGESQPIKQALRRLPSCVLEKTIWLFEDSRWIRQESLEQTP